MAIDMLATIGHSVCCKIKGRGRLCPSRSRAYSRNMRSTRTSRGAAMKRFAYVAIATAVLAFGVGACKKAHDAGNDSMDAPHGGISAISPSR
ncbi:hypothetical protein QYH69_13280 [Paraburkholderia sp. SARCC-3016]|nr:hypothetical protein [Paraburkholderia sp. SARCC-3016]